MQSRIKEMEASYLQQRIDEETKWKAKIAEDLQLKTAAGEERVDELRAKIVEMETKHGEVVETLETNIKGLDSKVAEMQAALSKASAASEEKTSKLMDEIATSKTRQEDFARKGKLLVAKVERHDREEGNT